nr:MAG TPA: hypothetical protein [Caudoviricetes sp.]
MDHRRRDVRAHRAHGIRPRPGRRRRPRPRHG